MYGNGRLFDRPVRIARRIPKDSERRSHTNEKLLTVTPRPEKNSTFTRQINLFKT
jgi:hypothetical protein